MIEIIKNGNEDMHKVHTYQLECDDCACVFSFNKYDIRMKGNLYCPWCGNYIKLYLYKEKMIRIT